MRLGKEQAAGYVEDLEVDAPAEELATAQPEATTPLATGADDPALTVS